MAKQKLFFIFLVLILIILTACILPFNTGEPPAEIDKTETMMVQAVLSQIIPTNTINPPTATRVPATKTPTITTTSFETQRILPTMTFNLTLASLMTPGLTSYPLVTVLYPSPAPSKTSIPAPKGDIGDFIDQDPAIGATFSRNQEFIMTWTIRNIGTTSWTPKYYVTFFGGSRIGDGPNIYYLTKEINPGERGTISVEMKTPDHTGTYTSTWFLMNENQHAMLELSTMIYVE